MSPGDDGLENLIQQVRLFRGWENLSAALPGADISPRYRGAFEEGELPPGRVRVGTLIQEGGASLRFRAPSKLVGPRREFGTSVELDPDVWNPVAQRRGWYIFAADFPSGPVLLGLWSSLPATWLAQGADGKSIPPPWRELWTFGSDHVWTCRFTASSSVTSDKDAFLAGCLDSRPAVPSRFAGSWQQTDKTLRMDV